MANIQVLRAAKWNLDRDACAPSWLASYLAHPANFLCTLAHAVDTHPGTGCFDIANPRPSSPMWSRTASQLFQKFFRVFPSFSVSSPRFSAHSSLPQWVHDVRSRTLTRIEPKEADSVSVRTPAKECAATTYVIGCNHGIQRADEDDLLAISNIAEVRNQRLHFKCLLEAILREHQVQFIGEEWGLPQPSTAKLLSKEKRIAWANVNTCLDDLNGMGIPHDYVLGPYDPAAKSRWNELRERFMLQRVLQSKGTAQNLVVVCGFHHLQAMAQLLGNSSATVQIVDYRNLSWYRAGVFCDDE